MKVCFLGHSPKDYGGWHETPLQTAIKAAIAAQINACREADSKLIILTSLALGPEMWAGQLAYDLKIPYHLYIPFKDPHSKWPERTAKKYSFLKKFAKNRVTISDGEYDAKFLLQKEQKLIEDADEIYSFWLKPMSATKFADRQKKQIQNILPALAGDDELIGL